jgi:hypothetical protein
LSIAAWSGEGQLTSGFISDSERGRSVSRMIIDSCTVSLGKGSRPVNIVKATSASD